MLTRIERGNADVVYQEKFGTGGKWLGIPEQVKCTTPRPEQLKILHYGNHYSKSILTALEAQKELEIRLKGLQHVVEQLIEMVKGEVREQTQEGKHTTSFVSGNNKVGTDSVCHFTHGFSGNYLHNSEKISMFDGEEALCNNEVSFEQWLFEVRSTQGLYS